MTSIIDYLSNPAEFERKFSSGETILRFYHCPVDWCDGSGFTILELKKHLQKHYRPTLERTLTKLAVKLQDSRDRI